MPVTFAARLKQLREKAGLSQADLAFKAGIHPQSVAKLEQGSRDPGFFTVKGLAEALGVTVSAFEDTVPAESTGQGQAGRPRKSPASQPQQVEPAQPSGQKRARKAAPETQPEPEKKGRKRKEQ